MLKGKKVVIEVILLVFIIILSFAVNKRNISVSTNNQAKLPIFRVNTEEKEIALTFDINWAEEEHLDEILQVLKKYDVKGTFFIMGGWINYTDDNKEKLKNIYNDGHEIGNHSYIHPNFVNITEERMNDELQKTEDIICIIALNFRMKYMLRYVMNLQGNMNFMEESGIVMEIL